MSCELGNCLDEYGGCCRRQASLLNNVVWGPRIAEYPIRFEPGELVRLIKGGEENRIEVISTIYECTIITAQGTDLVAFEGLVEHTGVQLSLPRPSEVEISNS